MPSLLCHLRLWVQVHFDQGFFTLVQTPGAFLSAIHSLLTKTNITFFNKTTKITVIAYIEESFWESLHSIRSNWSWLTTCLCLLCCNSFSRSIRFCLGLDCWRNSAWKTKAVCVELAWWRAVAVAVRFDVKIQTSITYMLDIK